MDVEKREGKVAGINKGTNSAELETHDTRFIGDKPVGGARTGVERSGRAYIRA